MMISETTNTRTASSTPAIKIKIPEFLTKPLSLPEKFTHEFARHAQSLVWFIAYPFLRIFFNIEINGKEQLSNLPPSLIIVSNHFSMFDSFLLWLLFKPYSPQLPLRFIAINKFDTKLLNFLNNIGLIPFIYALFSVIIVTIGAGIDKNLAEAKNVLAHNQSIVIYPEGGLNKSGILMPFKRGASVLGIDTEKDIFPVVFKIIKRPWKRSTVRINIGKIFKLERYLNYDQGTEIIYQKVNSLYLM